MNLAAPIEEAGGCHMCNMMCKRQSIILSPYARTYLMSPTPHDVNLLPPPSPHPTFPINLNVNSLEMEIVVSWHKVVTTMI